MPRLPRRSHGRSTRARVPPLLPPMEVCDVRQVRRLRLARHQRLARRCPRPHPLARQPLWTLRPRHWHERKRQLRCNARCRRRHRRPLAMQPPRRPAPAGRARCHPSSPPGSVLAPPRTPEAPTTSSMPTTSQLASKHPAPIALHPQQPLCATARRQPTAPPRHPRRLRPTHRSAPPMHGARRPPAGSAAKRPSLLSASSGARCSRAVALTVCCRSPALRNARPSSPRRPAPPGSRSRATLPCSARSPAPLPHPRSIVAPPAFPVRHREPTPPVARRSRYPPHCARHRHPAGGRLQGPSRVDTADDHLPDGDARRRS